MILDRFPAARSLKVVAWVAVLVGWTTALFARVGLASPTPAEAPPTGGATSVTVVGAEAVTVPSMPASGLVVIRHTPDPVPAVAAPDPVIRTVIVTKVVPGPQAPQTTSSGS